MDFLNLVSEVGFPIASAVASGYFVFLTLKFILLGVISSIKGLNTIIVSLDDRVRTMTHDVIRIDTIVSEALGLNPDVERIARKNGREDSRKD